MTDKKWYDSASFYHIYPLGYCGALERQKESESSHRLGLITKRLDYIKNLGFNAIYLGPVFESDYHGYETVDYFRVDRRLGDNDDLKTLVEKAHERGIRVALDGVFNHAGRGLFAFQKLLEAGSDSEYIDWFSNVDFHANNHHGDGFSYGTWENHEELVKLNLENEEVKNYLLEAVSFWKDEFDIDGIRLDAADCLDMGFVKSLRAHTDTFEKDFWLRGEIIHGDYRKWLGDDRFHSVTNYEVHKGLYSSFNDSNFYEIAYSLNRQFGEGGLYRDYTLYNFLDNHDVSRITSRLQRGAHLYPLHLLLFTIPGNPSIYYGSEWAIEGKRNETSDEMVRPFFDLDTLRDHSDHKSLFDLIQKLNWFYMQYDALKYGGYEQILVDHEQLAFRRHLKEHDAIIAVNSSGGEKTVHLKAGNEGRYYDVLNDERYNTTDGGLAVKLFPNWGAILVAD